MKENGNLEREGSAKPSLTLATLAKPGGNVRSTPITARELVEWTYAAQRAQGVRQPSVEPQGRSQTGIVVDRITEFAELGCAVDVSGNAMAIWGEAPCDEDAMTVHAIIDRMRRPARGPLTTGAALLVKHGALRSVPAWNPQRDLLIMPLRCVPVPGRKGKNKGIYAHHGKTLIGSAITYEGDWPDRITAMMVRAAWQEGPHLRCATEIIDHARLVYRDWIGTLALLCDRLEAAGRRGLRRFRISGLGAEYEPWRTSAATARNARLDVFRKSVD